MPASDVIACQFCESEISASARKCRFCGEWVNTDGECRECGVPLRGEWAKRGICAGCDPAWYPPQQAQAPPPPPQTVVVQQENSGGNVLAAVASFFIPGLGQLAQGRFLSGVFIFFLTGFLWLILLGWIGHLVACLDAALYKPKRRR